MKYILFLTTLVLLAIGGCKKQNTNNIAAYIEDVPVYYNEVDNLVKQELYDELSRIYTIRQMALDELIGEKTLFLEAEKQKTTKNNLLDKLYKSQLDSFKLSAYSSKIYPEGRISTLKDNFVSHDINSKEGQILLVKDFKKHLKKQYIDSLKSQYTINTFLNPPLSPIIKVNNAITHSRGYIKSKITLLEISDYDCDVCEENQKIIAKLYSKYKDKVCFQFSHYGSYVSNSVIATESANLQGKFWEMHDAVFEYKSIPDTSQLFILAEEIGLNMDEFTFNFYDNNLNEKINTSLFNINSLGIYSTPTILVNGRLVHNPSSEIEIENAIQRELSKLK